MGRTGRVDYRSTERLYIEIPTALRDLLTRQAADQQRSRNALIVDILSVAVNAEGDPECE